jgi:hypothetical protein
MVNCSKLWVASVSKRKEGQYKITLPIAEREKERQLISREGMYETLERNCRFRNISIKTRKEQKRRDSQLTRSPFV